VSGSRKRRIVESEKWYVMARDRETCVYCGWRRGQFVPASVPRSIHVDHITPFSRGGEPTRENLVCACSRCNLYKGDRTPEEAGMEIAYLQERVEYICGCIFEVRLEGDPE
jgi:5-methylcytosine-specific restriction endonuclease McrA